MGHAVKVLDPLVEQWKPSSSRIDEDEGSGIYLNMCLPQALLMWQEGVLTMFDDFSYSQTRGSIPPNSWVFQIHLIRKVDKESNGFVFVLFFYLFIIFSDFILCSSLICF